MISPSCPRATGCRSSSRRHPGSGSRCPTSRSTSWSDCTESSSTSCRCRCPTDSPSDFGGRRFRAGYQPVVGVVGRDVARHEAAHSRQRHVPFGDRIAVALRRVAGCIFFRPRGGCCRRCRSCREVLTLPFVPMPTRMSALPPVVMLSWPINPSAARALPTVGRREGHVDAAAHRARCARGDDAHRRAGDLRASRGRRSSSFRPFLSLPGTSHRRLRRT